VGCGAFWLGWFLFARFACNITNQVPNQRCRKVSTLPTQV
jgi:hypothetical protein